MTINCLHKISVFNHSEPQNGAPVKDFRLAHLGFRTKLKSPSVEDPQAVVSAPRVAEAITDIQDALFGNRGAKTS